MYHSQYKTEQLVNKQKEDRKTKEHKQPTYGYVSKCTPYNTEIHKNDQT